MKLDLKTTLNAEEFNLADLNYDMFEYHTDTGTGRVHLLYTSNNIDTGTGRVHLLYTSNNTDTGTGRVQLL